MSHCVPFGRIIHVTGGIKEKGYIVSLLRILQLPAVGMLKLAMWLVALLRGEQSGLEWEDNVTTIFWMVAVTFVLLIITVAFVLATLGSLLGAISFVVSLVISSIALFTSPPPVSKK